MKLTHQSFFTVTILLLSILSLTPTLAHADQQTKTETINIELTGEATSIGNGPSGPATLSLTAAAYKNSNSWLIIQNTTGLLKIGSSNFPVTGGHGSSSSVGAIAIFCNTASGELILQGTMDGDSVTFQMPSQLTSTSYLSLSGTIGSRTQQSSNVVTGSTSSVENSTISVASKANTAQQKSTSSSAQQINSTSSTRTLQNATTSSPVTTVAGSATTTSQITNTTQSMVDLATSIGNATLPAPSSGVEQFNVMIRVVQGEGEICLTSQLQLPVCTSSSQTVPVNKGELVNFDSDAGSGFAWDHYDGLGFGQSQNFNANITQDALVGAYFSPTQGGGVNAVTSSTISSVMDGIVTSQVFASGNTLPAIPTDNVTTSNPFSSATMPVITTATAGDSTVTVTQYVNQTVFVTQTVADATVNYTVTTTVANLTITQATVTTAVNSTMTTTGP